MAALSRIFLAGSALALLAACGPKETAPAPAPEAKAFAAVDTARIETASAGLNNDAEQPLTTELLAWSDLIVCMEKSHRNRLSAKFKAHLDHQRIVVLNIPDEFDYMDPELVQLLKARVPRHLPTL